MALGFHFQRFVQTLVLFSVLVLVLVLVWVGAPREEFDSNINNRGVLALRWSHITQQDQSPLLAAAPLDDAPVIKLPTALSIEKPARLANINLAGTPSAKLGLPPWANTSITRTNATLVITARAAITRLLDYFDPNTKIFRDIGWWQSANVYWSILNYDVLLSTNRFRDLRRRLGELSTQGPPPWVGGSSPTTGFRNEYNDDMLWWGLACDDALLLERTPNGRLKDGLDIFNWINSTSVITRTGIAPNMGGIKRTKVLSTKCKLEAGVYWTTKPDDAYVNSITTGLFFLHSARLCEATRQRQWLRAAEKALRWLQTHTVDAQMLVVDGVHGDTCVVSPRPYTYNTGVYIGGLTSLYRCTRNESYLLEAEEAAIAAMETRVWTDGAGMIIEQRGAQRNSDGAGFRCVLIRMLVNLYKTTRNAEVRAEIRGFVNVNYNRLYTQARRGDDYDGNWFGPFKGRTSWGQMSAIDLLNAGMVVNDVRFGEGGSATVMGQVDE